MPMTKPWALFSVGIVGDSSFERAGDVAGAGEDVRNATGWLRGR